MALDDEHNLTPGWTDFDASDPLDHDKRHPFQGHASVEANEPPTLGLSGKPSVELKEGDFIKFKLVDLKDKGDADYRLISIPTPLRDHYKLKGKVGSKLYVVLEVPKLDLRGRIRRRRDDTIIFRQKTILTQWELKNPTPTQGFGADTIAFNDVIREQFKSEFAAMGKNTEGGQVVVSIMLDKSIKLLDGIWYSILCQHPDKNVNVAMLFLYLSLIPSTLFLLLGMAIEVFGVNDLIRNVLGLSH